MAKFTRYSCFLLLILPYLQVSAIEPVTLATVSAAIGIVTGIITFVKQVSEGVEGGTRYLGEKPETSDGHYERPFNPMHSNIMDHLRYLSRRQDLFKIDMENMRDDIISQITEQVPGLVELNSRLSKIFINSKIISKYYDDFLEYYENPENYDNNKVLQFAKKMISEDNNGVSHLLEDIYTLLVLDDFTSASTIALLNKHIMVFLENGRILKSPQNLLYDILHSVIHTEIKGYLTMKYSYRLLDLYKQGNYVGHVQKTEFDFGKRINNTISIFKDVMVSASRELWKGNPIKHVEDVTFTELKRVFQEFIINEKDLNRSDKCQNTCSDYRIPQGKADSNCSYPGEICEYTHCDGYLHDCRYKIDTEMNICLSAHDSNRRYEYIDYGNGLRYGDTNAKCAIQTTKTKRHFSLLWWCDTCMCVCADSTSKSERKFSLDPVMANTADNYVITGVRFVKKNGIIYIQIQEGQLLRSGQINASTVTWSKINKKPFRTYTLQWEDSREINLDDIITPKNYVLTGLTFTTQLVDTTNYHQRLQLKAFSSYLDFYSDQLVSKHHMTFINTVSKDEIKLDNRDIPTRTSVKTVTRSRPDQFLKFRPTGLEKDVGQSTIPFIDLQEVVSIPPVPMSGVGIYHKGRIDNGGFLAFKLFTYDYAQHLKADLPENFKHLKSIESV